MPTTPPPAPMPPNITSNATLSLASAAIGTDPLSGQLALQIGDINSGLYPSKATTDNTGEVVKIDSGISGTYDTSAATEGQVISGNLDGSTLDPSPDFVYLGRWKGDLQLQAEGATTLHKAMPYVLGVKSTADLYSLTPNNEYLSYKLVNPTQQYVSVVRPDATLQHDVGYYKYASFLLQPSTSSATLQAQLIFTDAYAGETPVYDLQSNFSLSYGSYVTSLPIVTKCNVNNSCSQYSAALKGFLSGDNAERLGLSIGFVDGDQGVVGTALVLDRGSNVSLAGSSGNYSLSAAGMDKTLGWNTLYGGNTVQGEANTDQVFHQFKQASTIVIDADKPTLRTSDAKGTWIAGSTDGLGNVSNDFAYLGTWTGLGAASNIHDPVTGQVLGAPSAMVYVLGAETPRANLDSFGSLYYNLADPYSHSQVVAVRPDGSVVSNGMAGSLTQASLDLDAATASVSLFAKLNLSGSNSMAPNETYVTNSNSIPLNPGLSNFSGVVNMTNQSSGGQTPGQASGLFIGPNALRAGVTLNFSDPSLGQIGVGAVLEHSHVP
ncbi:MAG: hypothetical protein ACH34Y_08850 [Brachymonas sp.]